jgi:hypothetical protein
MLVLGIVDLWTEQVRSLAGLHVVQIQHDGNANAAVSKPSEILGVRFRFLRRLVKGAEPTGD